MKFRLHGATHHEGKLVRRINGRTPSKSNHRAKVEFAVGDRRVVKTVNVNPERFK